MSQFFLLGAQIFDVTVMRYHFESLAGHAHAITFETFELMRIVSQQACFAHSEVTQNLSPDTVIPQVFLEPELEICFDCVESLILQCIRLDFVAEADTASFLMKVN